MASNPLTALQAYGNSAAMGGSGEGAAKPGAAAGEAGRFAEMLKGAVETTIDAQRQSEAATQSAIEGKAEMADVVMAVGNAEVALQTVVAVRDRVIQAYQEVMRMPI